MKKNLLLILLLTLNVVFFSACGGGASSTSSGDSITPITPSSSTQYTGYLIDSPVGGIEYKCGSLTGITKSDGSFKYTKDCTTVEFSLGKFYLGDINTTLLSDNIKIYPTDILGYSTKDIKQTKVISSIRLLQSLDTDQNTSNGIFIDETTRNTILNQINIPAFNFKENAISEYDLNLTFKKIYPNRTLIDSNASLSDLNNSMINNGLDTSSINPSKPAFVNPYNLAIITYDHLSTKVQARKFKLKGEAGNSIYYVLDTNDTNTAEPLDSEYQPLDNLKIGHNGYQDITLKFNTPTITSYHYYFKLKDNYGKSSESIELWVDNDTIPPNLLNTTIEESLNEQQKLFRNIYATDGNLIKVYDIIDINESNKSLHWDLFTIDNNGTVTFKTEPDFDNNTSAKFQVVARAIDAVGNMTDILLNIALTNILDNPPKLIVNTYSKNIEENTTNGTEVFDTRNLLKTVENAPDNNSTLFPMIFSLTDDINGTFAIEDNTTGVITIKNKDGNNSLFDYEDRLHNTINLNVSIQNGNTKYKDANNITQDCNTTCEAWVNTVNAIITVNIQNVIDKAPTLLGNSSRSIPELSDDFSNYKIYIPVDTNNSDFNTSNTKFRIIFGNDDKHFTIRNEVDSTGNVIAGVIEVNTSNPLNYEIQREYNLGIEANNTWWNNDNGLSNQVIQNIKIINVVDKIPFIKLTSDSNISIPENTGANKLVATFETNGTIFDGSGIIHDENNVTTYKIISILKNNENISVATSPFTEYFADGNLTTTRQLNINSNNDYVEKLDANDTVYKVTVKATTYFWNSTGVTDIQYSNDVNVTINVSNIIDTAPVLPSTSMIDFDENQTAQTYDINTSGDTFDTKYASDFNITSGDLNKTFVINSSGIVSLDKKLDYETNKTHTLFIKAWNYLNNDLNGTKQYSNEMILTVTVKNKYEIKPSLIHSKTLDVHENIDIGEVIAIIDINTSASEDEQKVENFIKSFVVKDAGGKLTTKFSATEMTDNNTSLKYVELKVAEKLNFEDINGSKYFIELNATNEFTTPNEYNSTIINTTDVNITVNIIDDVDKDLPLLVVMVEYNDINITTSTSDMFNKIFSQNSPTPPVFGSLNDYFNRVSKEKFLFKKATEGDGSNDGIVKVTLTQNHPQADINRLAEDIIAVIKDINTTKVTFSTFDSNGDNNISKDELQLLFIFAGGEATYGDTNLSIKATSGTLTPITVNGGKTLTGNYVIVGERNGNNPASIGLIAHHLANTALKFPYLNDRTNASYGIGFFGLMGYGYRGAIDTNASIGSTPVNPSAYNILSQGWVHPKTINKTTQNIDMVASNKGIDGFNILKIPTTDSKIYYLLENRVKTNLVGYDDGFFAMENTSFNGGLALWKIDEKYTSNDQVNTKLVDLIEYDNNTDINSIASNSYGKSSALYHVAAPKYPTNLTLPFSISSTNTDLEPNTNKMTIDISVP